VEAGVGSPAPPSEPAVAVVGQCEHPVARPDGDDMVRFVQDRQEASATLAREPQYLPHSGCPELLMLALGTELAELPTWPREFDHLQDRHPTGVLVLDSPRVCFEGTLAWALPPGPHSSVRHSGFDHWLPAGSPVSPELGPLGSQPISPTDALWGAPDLNERFLVFRQIKRPVIDLAAVGASG
jgi:hypothetical protein